MKLTEECATYWCESEATVRFEYGGIGSWYCMDCYLRVQRLPKYPASTGRAALEERGDG